MKNIEKVMLSSNKPQFFTKEMWQKVTLNLKVFLYLRQFVNEEKLPHKKIKTIQLSRLKKLLCNAYENHDFYRKRFDQCGFNPYQITNIEEIKKIPILTKKEYRDFIESTYNKNPKTFEAYYKDGTSGSTGRPLNIYRTWNERAYMVSKWMRVLVLNGYSWSDKTFSLPSPHRLHKDSFFQRFGLMKRYSVSYTAPTKEMVSQYIKTNPDVLYANKSQLVMMAMFAKTNDLELNIPKLCVSAAETMDENSQRIICEVFGKENFIEAYGAVEFNNLAWQEKGQSFFNFSHTTNLLEVVNNDGQYAESGRTLITDFFIKSFPLIRYDLGDYVETVEFDKLPKIRKIKGRMDDWLVFSNYERIPFHFFYEIMERRMEISQFRIIQESYFFIKIQLVLGTSADKPTIEKKILRDIKLEIKQEGVEYQFEWLNEIPPDPNGKLRMIINNLQE